MHTYSLSCVKVVIGVDVVMKKLRNMLTQLSNEVQVSVWIEIQMICISHHLLVIKIKNLSYLSGARLPKL